MSDCDFGRRRTAGFGNERRTVRLRCISLFQREISTIMRRYFIIQVGRIIILKLPESERVKKRITAVYNKRSAMDGAQDYYNFKFYPDFKTPDWAKGGGFLSDFYRPFLQWRSIQ